jgi:hypothetical protein
MASSEHDHPLLTEEVARVANAFNYRIEVREDGIGFSLSSSPWALRVDQVTVESYFLALYCRITSWDASGERSDLNDLLSHFATSFLREIAHRSSRLIDIPHPVLPPSGEATLAILFLNSRLRLSRQMIPGVMSLAGCCFRLDASIICLIMPSLSQLRLRQPTMTSMLLHHSQSRLLMR